MEAVLIYKMSICEARKMHNILKRTLWRKLLQKLSEKSSLGRKSQLGSHVEERLVCHVLKLQATGFALTRKIVCSMAFNLGSSGEGNYVQS